MTSMLKKFLLCFTFVCVLAGAAVASAPTADGWQQVDGNMISAGDTIPARRLVGAAYGFIFAALAIYVGSVAARTRRIESEIDELKRKLEAQLKAQAG